jgi:DNA-binding MarR family transcriptional regulator
MTRRRAPFRDLDRELGPVLAFMRTLWALAHALDSRSKQMNALRGITGPQRLVVRVVAQLGPIAPGRLADVLHLHPASVTRLAKTLEARGMLRRRPDPADGRRLLLEVGAAAARLLGPIPGSVEGAAHRVLRKATKREVAGAARVVGRIATALEPR